MSPLEDVGVALRRHYRTTANAEPAIGQLEAVLVETVTTPQRSAWTLRERWLPLSPVAGATFVSPLLPWRMIGIAAILVLALAIAATVVGNQPRRLPPPFGPARNGLIAYENARDIYVGDPQSGTTTAIVTGFEDDLAPTFSPDGTHIVFLRRSVDGPPGERNIVVIRPDGSDLRVITDAPLPTTADGMQAWECCGWTPDSSAVIALVARTGSEESGPVLMAYPITGGTEPFEFAPGVSSLSIGWGPHGQGGLGNVYAALRPPRGDRVLVANDAASDSGHSLMVVDGDGSNATTPLRLMFYSLSSPAWSPDGSRILFAASVDVPGPCAECWRDQRVYVISADGSRLRRLSNATRADPPNVIVVESAPSWSPDGRRIGLMRRVGPAGDRGMPQEPGALVVVDVETGVERGAYGAGLGLEDWTWSPDGRSILVGRAHLADFSNRMVLVDVESGEPEVLPWDHLSTPTWQRLAR